MSWLGAVETTGSAVGLALLATALPALGLWWRQEQRFDAERRRLRRLREEFETYTRLDLTLPPDEEERDLAVRVCRTVSQMSCFPRVALLLESAQERLHVAGSAGFDDMAIEALGEWGTEAMREGRGRRHDDGRSFMTTLRPRQQFGAMEASHSHRVLLFPLAAANGRIYGALAASTLEEPLAGSRVALEMLAGRLGDAVENYQLTQRLRESEKRTVDEDRKRLAVA